MLPDLQERAFPRDTEAYRQGTKYKKDSFATAPIPARSSPAARALSRTGAAARDPQLPLLSRPGSPAPPPDPSLLRAPRPLRPRNAPPRAPARPLCPPPAIPEPPSSHRPGQRPPVPSVPAVPVPGADMGPPGAAADSSAPPRPPSAAPLTAAGPPPLCLTHGAAPTEPAAPCPPRPGAKGGAAPLHGGRAEAEGGAERPFPRSGGQAARRAAPRGVLAADGLPGVRRRKGKRNGKGNGNGNGRGKGLGPASLAAAGKGETAAGCRFLGGPSARLGLGAPRDVTAVTCPCPPDVTAAVVSRVRPSDVTVIKHWGDSG